MFELLFSPIKIGKLQIKNRLAVSAMDTNYSDAATGQVTDRYINYFEARAKGGFGLITSEYTAVEERGKGSDGETGLWDDSLIPGHKKLTDAIHKHGAKIFVQLHHAGNEAWPAIMNGTGTVSSSPIMSAHAYVPNPVPTLMPIPKELSTDEVKAMVVKFIDAAERAKKAGYDGAEIHGTHGYFVCQFLSSFNNKRTDEYGGTLYNRARILLEIISGIKNRCGSDFPVVCRISVDDYAPGGNNIEDAKTIAMLAEQAGADAVNTSCGSDYALTGNEPTHKSSSSSEGGHGLLVGYIGEIKKTVSIPVYAVNRINDPYIAEAILKSGKADIISMGRASLADPELPIKTKEGRIDEIIHCMACFQACQGHLHAGLPISCIFNPSTGREAEFAIKTDNVKKKVFIAGGGPGGMEAAIVAAKRGHEVELFEKDDKLGGQFVLAGVPPYKSELNSFTVWQKNQLKMHNVKVHLNTALTPELVEQGNVDAVIVATGATNGMPPIKGIDNPKIVSAFDVLAGTVVGKNTIVIGGGQIGVEVADHLALHGRSVTIVEMLPAIGQKVLSIATLLKDFEAKKVKVYVSAQVQEITNDGLIIKVNGEEISLGADTIVIATGTKSVNDLTEKLQGKVKKLITVGDAKIVRTAEEAILEGYEAGLQV